MRLWIDDVRPAPEGYYWCKTVNEAKEQILLAEKLEKRFMERGNKFFKERKYVLRSKMYDLANKYSIDLIDMDHDAGFYALEGGDYIKLLDWLEETGRNYPIRIHSMNPVGIENMQRIIRKNGWKEVK